MHNLGNNENKIKLRRQGRSDNTVQESYVSRLQVKVDKAMLVDDAHAGSDARSDGEPLPHGGAVVLACQIPARVPHRVVGRAIQLEACLVKWK